MFSILLSIHLLKGADKENLSNNQELLWLVISPFILLTSMFDSG